MTFNYGHYSHTVLIRIKTKCSVLNAKAENGIPVLKNNYEKC